MTGRTSSFIGPTVYGFIAAHGALWYQARGQAVALAEQSGQRMAILSIAAFLVLGIIGLLFVNEKRGIAAAEKANEQLSKGLARSQLQSLVMRREASSSNVKLSGV